MSGRARGRVRGGLAEPGEGGAEGVVSEGDGMEGAARACFRNCTIRGMRSMAAACTEVMSPPIMMTRSGGCERPAAGPARPGRTSCPRPSRS